MVFLCSISLVGAHLYTNFALVHLCCVDRDLLKAFIDVKLISFAMFGFILSLE